MCTVVDVFFNYKSILLKTKFVIRCTPSGKDIEEIATGSIIRPTALTLGFNLKQTSNIKIRITNVQVTKT